MSAISSARSGRIGRAGTPSARYPAGIRCPGATRAPAPICAPVSITAPSGTRAPMPIRAPSSIVQPWIMAWWPITTSAPIESGNLSCVTWSTAPSWTLVRAPMRIQWTSPRATVWNQNETSSPSSTSPATCAEGASHTRRPRTGRRPSNGWTGMSARLPARLLGRLGSRRLRGGLDREEDPFVQRAQLRVVRVPGLADEIDAGLRQRHLERQAGARLDLLDLGALDLDQDAFDAIDLARFDLQGLPAVVLRVVLPDRRDHVAGRRERDRADAHVDEVRILVRLRVRRTDPEARVVQHLARGPSLGHFEGVREGQLRAAGKRQPMELGGHRRGLGRRGSGGLGAGEKGGEGEGKEQGAQHVFLGWRAPAQALGLPRCGRLSAGRESMA